VAAVDPNPLKTLQEALIRRPMLAHLQRFDLQRALASRKQIRGFRRRMSTRCANSLRSTLAAALQRSDEVIAQADADARGFMAAAICFPGGA
jgi:hypothetical protein